jgi:uncharacterized protein YebE (UPF0316 family)
MQSTLAESLGLSPTIFQLVVIPILIFLARIMDVSINTVRIIYMLNNKRWIATVMGFFEALIWLMAIGQILQSIDSPVSYIAYAGGFAGGIYVGMLIENRLAIGSVMVRIITTTEGDKLVERIKENSYRLTHVDAEGAKGHVKIIFLILERKRLQKLINTIQYYNPSAFYTVEGVKFVKNTESITETIQPGGWRSFLKKAKA